MHKSFKSCSTRRQVRSAISIALLAVVVVFAALPSFASSDDQARKFTTLTGNHLKQQFLAGERVEVTKANVADDIFAAGRDLTFEAVSAKHIIAVGMSLSLKGITANDLILAGGQADISGNVKDDVVAAVCPICPFGGRLHMTRSTQIGDDARLVGREITVDGRIGGDLYAAAQYFKLSGEVVGNARVEAERIVLAPGARISGNLLYTGPTKPEVADGAVVSGRIRQVDTGLPFAREAPKGWIWYALLFVPGLLLALVLLAAIMQFGVPGLLSSAAETAVRRPWASLGRGLVLALLVPAAAALLMSTIIGAPIGLVTMAAFFVLLAVAFTGISYCIGLYVRGLFGKKQPPSGLGSRVLWSTAGILIVVIVGLVPFVGWAIGMLAMIAGLGASISEFGPLFRKTNTVPA